MFEHQYPKAQGKGEADFPHAVSAATHGLCASARKPAPIAPEGLIRVTRKGERLLAAYEARRFRRAA